MPRAALTRRVTFAAAHRYRKPEWSDEENRRVFGACAHPHYHGHTYTCDVTVAGVLNETTGMVVDLGLLDRVLAAEVVSRFDHKNICLDVPEFGDGALIPTGENLARFIAHRVQAALGEAATVVEVRLAEDDRLSATFWPRDGERP